MFVKGGEGKWKGDSWLITNCLLPGLSACLSPFTPEQSARLLSVCSVERVVVWVVDTEWWSLCVCKRAK